MTGQLQSPSPQVKGVRSFLAISFHFPREEVEACSRRLHMPPIQVVLTRLFTWQYEHGHL